MKSDDKGYKVDKEDKELTALLAEMKEYGEANHVPIINSQGLRVLTEAVAQKKPRRVLEIGTAIGYSTLYIAANSAGDVEIVTLELSDERADEAEDFIGRSRFAGQIDIIRGDAGENILETRLRLEHLVGWNILLWRYVKPVVARRQASRQHGYYQYIYVFHNYCVLDCN